MGFSSLDFRVEVNFETRVTVVGSEGMERVMSRRVMR